MRLQRDLREFVELLNSESVEFLIVGGHAVAFHGYPRYTGDLDFFVRPTLENAEKLIAALETFGFGSMGVTAEVLTEPDKVIQLGRVPNRIDLLTSISGVDFDDAWSTRVAGELDGIPVQYIGRDALLRNKSASGRAKDLGDIEELERQGGG
ncbi:MAG TPA: nucleotidyltransferase [Sandaracinaceae bacterium LLY-WYZ-13_1]|nr:nucleotidyltransferase [Sandaracinaceae bacterium LLY-WYZ-13_1]